MRDVAIQGTALSATVGSNATCAELDRRRIRVDEVRETQWRDDEGKPVSLGEVAAVEVGVGVLSPILVPLILVDNEDYDELTRKQKGNRIAAGLVLGLVVGTGLVLSGIIDAIVSLDTGREKVKRYRSQAERTGEPHNCQFEPDAPGAAQIALGARAVVASIGADGRLTADIDAFEAGDLLDPEKPMRLRLPDGATLPMPVEREARVQLARQRAGAIRAEDLSGRRVGLFPVETEGEVELSGVESRGLADLFSTALAAHGIETSGHRGIRQLIEFGADSDRRCVSPECQHALTERLGLVFALYPTVSRRGRGCEIAVVPTDLRGPLTYDPVKISTGCDAEAIGGALVTIAGTLATPATPGPELSLAR